VQHPFWGDVSSFSRCEAAFLKIQTKPDPSRCLPTNNQAPVQSEPDYRGTDETLLGAPELASIYSLTAGLISSPSTTYCGYHLLGLHEGEQHHGLVPLGNVCPAISSIRSRQWHVGKIASSQDVPRRPFSSRANSVQGGYWFQAGAGHHWMVKKQDQRLASRQVVAAVAEAKLMRSCVISELQETGVSPGSESNLEDRRYGRASGLAPTRVGESRPWGSGSHFFEQRAHFLTKCLWFSTPLTGSCEFRPYTYLLHYASSAGKAFELRLHVRKGSLAPRVFQP